MQTTPRAKLDGGAVWLFCTCATACPSLSLIIRGLRQIEGGLAFDLNLHTIYPRHYKPSRCEFICVARPCPHLCVCVCSHAIAPISECVRAAVSCVCCMSAGCKWTMSNVCSMHRCEACVCVCAQKRSTHWCLRVLTIFSQNLH